MAERYVVVFDEFFLFRVLPMSLSISMFSGVFFAVSLAAAVAATTAVIR